jgi:hypothetical protein
VLIDNNAAYCKIADRRLIEEAVVPKSNDRHLVEQAKEVEQSKLLDATNSQPLPKAKPARYTISKRKKVG